MQMWIDHGYPAPFEHAGLGSGRGALISRRLARFRQSRELRTSASSRHRNSCTRRNRRSWPDATSSTCPAKVAAGCARQEWATPNGSGTAPASTRTALKLPPQTASRRGGLRAPALGNPSLNPRPSPGSHASSPVGAASRDGDRSSRNSSYLHASAALNESQLFASGQGTNRECVAGFQRSRLPTT